MKPPKRHLNAVILPDQILKVPEKVKKIEKKHRLKEAVINMLHLGLQSKSCYIIVHFGAFFEYMKIKGKEESFLKKHDVYKYPDAQLVILIPKKYREKVIAEYREKVTDNPISCF